MKSTHFQKIILSLLALALLAACSSAVPSAAPAATLIPLSERDLAEVALQQSEVPSLYDTLSVEDIQGVFPEVPAIHQGVVNSHIVLIKSEDNRHVYTNGIIVYEDQDLAREAYQGVIAGLRDKTESSTRPVGDEQFAMLDIISHPAMKNNIYMSMIIWRSGESMIYLSAADADAEPSKDQMETLAQKIQGRLVGP